MYVVFFFSPVAVEMEEMKNRKNSESRENLTPELQDPAPHKKKKKKKTPTIGNTALH